MFRMTLLAAILLAFTTAAQPGPDCDDPAAVFDDWFAEAHAELVADEDVFSMSDPGWAELFDDFAGIVVDFADECAEPDYDLSYDGEFVTNELRQYTYDVIPSVTPLDINLDGVDEWLLRLHIGPPGGGRTFVRMLYWDDDEWLTAEIWDAERFELSGGFSEPQPVGVFVHDQADVQGRTYMGIHFQPGIGPFLHVGGLSVLRWDGWEPDEVLVIEQGCYGAWQRSDDGGLYIPTGSAHPWEGCMALPPPQSGQGIQIPGARMP